MCRTIYINEKLTIETPGEFEKHFGFPAIQDDLYRGDIVSDACLCQVDIDQTFEEKGVKFKFDPSFLEYSIIDQDSPCQTNSN